MPLQKWLDRTETLEEIVNDFDKAGFSLAWMTFRCRKTGRVHSHKIEKGRV